MYVDQACSSRKNERKRKRERDEAEREEVRPANTKFPFEAFSFEGFSRERWKTWSNQAETGKNKFLAE